MERTVITQGDAVAETAPSKDDFLARVVKTIPAEVVALYLFTAGVINSALKEPTQLGQRKLWLWVMLIVGLALTPPYLHKIAKVWKPAQIVMSTLAFAVWVFAIGGPFELYSWYQPFVGSIVLAVFATATGVLQA